MPGHGFGSMIESFYDRPEHLVRRPLEVPGEFDIDLLGDLKHGRVPVRVSDDGNIVTVGLGQEIGLQTPDGIQVV